MKRELINRLIEWDALRSRNHLHDLYSAAVSAITCSTNLLPAYGLTRGGSAGRVSIAGVQKKRRG